MSEASESQLLMAPYKRYRGIRRPRAKYSVEQQAGTLSVPAASQAYAQVVPDTAIQGMRKVKHLTVSVAAKETVVPSSQSLAYWALVYVPQGTSVNSLSVTGTTGLYEPNQYVMNCGVVDFSAGPVRFTSRVARNLNSGDKVVLIMANPNTTDAASYFYCVRYAVSF